MHWDGLGRYFFATANLLWAEELGSIRRQAPAFQKITRRVRIQNDSLVSMGNQSHSDSGSFLGLRSEPQQGTVNGVIETRYKASRFRYVPSC
jgi:hypothetical protein